MTDFYLITGFLGAGKTTFLKKFIPLFAPRRIYLIINEFGREGVDSALLRELGAQMAEINNGSIFCTCRLDRFESELDAVAADAPDVIITEASGLSDPTNIRRILEERPWLRYRGSICLADAARIQKVFSTARMCPRQIAVASLVLLNKTDAATPEQCAQAERLILEANPAAHVERTSFGGMEPDWLRFVAPNIDVGTAAAHRDITLQKALITLSEGMTRASLEHCLAMLAEDTYRIKGFVRLAEGPFFVDCTGLSVQLTPWNGETNNRLVLLAGAGMPLRKAVKAAVQWYQNDIKEWEL